MLDENQTAELLDFTTTIVAAHVSHNAMPASDLPRLIATVHEAARCPRPAPLTRSYFFGVEPATARLVSREKKY